MITKRAATIISSIIGAGYMGFMGVGFISCFVWGFISCCLIDLVVHNDVVIKKSDNDKGSSKTE